MSRSAALDEPGPRAPRRASSAGRPPGGCVLRGLASEPGAAAPLCLGQGGDPASGGRAPRPRHRQLRELLLPPCRRGRSGLGRRPGLPPQPSGRPLLARDAAPTSRLKSAHAPRAMAITGLPLVGLTMAGDGALSARFWERAGRRTSRRLDCENVRVVGGRLVSGLEPTSAPGARGNQGPAEDGVGLGRGGTRPKTSPASTVGVIGAGSIVLDGPPRGWRAAASSASS